MLKKKLYFYLVCLLLLFLGIMVWYWQDSWKTKGFALRQETKDWAEWKKKLPPSTDISALHSEQTAPEAKPGVLLRYAGGNGILLLKHTIGDGVYLYDSAVNKTEKTTEQAWRNGQGNIVVCEKQRWTRMQEFNMDNARYKLISWGEDKTPYETYGNYALDAVISPSREKAAILSAYGPKRPFLNIGWIGLGGADYKIYGQRYIQIMNLKTKEYIDKPVKLYSESEIPCFSSCWSEDERILIAYQCDFSDFQIVEPFFSSTK